MQTPGEQLARSASRVRSIMQHEVAATLAIVTESGAPTRDFMTAIEAALPTKWFPAKHNLHTELRGRRGKTHNRKTLAAIDEFIEAGGLRVVGFYDTDFQATIGGGTSNIIAALKERMEKYNRQPDELDRHLGILAIGPRRPVTKRIDNRGISPFTLLGQGEWRVLSASGELKMTLGGRDTPV